MDSKILSIAKKDIPLYFSDFKSFWDSTNKFFNDADLTDCYAATLLMKNWIASLNHIKITVLDELLRETHEDINTSFFHAYFGSYRSAHMHLRSYIELSLQSIYFYQHEVEYEQWKSGSFRIKHEDLADYLKKHPNLNSKDANDVITEITKSWKHFSKYIHAEAPIFFQTTMKSKISKSITKQDFGVWKSNFLKTTYLINRLYLMFYRTHLNTFPTSNRELLLRNQKKKDLKILGIKA